MWGSMGRCVWGVGRGVGKIRRSVGRDGGVGKCWERSRECKKVWEAVRCAVRGVLGKGRRVYHTSTYTFPNLPHFPSKPKQLEFSIFQCNYTLFNVRAPRKF